MSGRMLFHSTAAAILVLAAGACAGLPASQPSSPSAAPAATSIALPAGFPLGSWVVTITEQDMRDGNVLDPQLVRENVGRFTKTYAPDGTFTVVQEAPTEVRWPVFRGTFTPTGTDGIEEHTTFPPEYVGEVLNFTWKRDGSAVRFAVRDAQDPMLKIVTETYAWQPK